MAGSLAGGGWEVGALRGGVTLQQETEDEEVLALGLPGDRARQTGGTAGAKALR